MANEIERSPNNQGKTLKVVLEQMQILSSVHKGTENLIKELIYKEKKLLKLNEGTASNDSDDESSKRVMALLEKERNIIFDESNIELDNAVTQINMRKRRNPPKNVIFPVMPKHKMNRMFSVLKSEKDLSDYEKNLDNCLSHIHTSAKPPWNSPSVILKAIKDCILRRKWDNLSKLLLMFLQFPCPRYKPIIRHICQILDKYHPVIRRNRLQNQLNMIFLRNKSKKLIIDN